jgi:hypothetical protein
VVVACAACHSGGGETPDGDMVGSAGLIVTWSSDPQIPGDAGNNITVSRVQLKIDTLRIIGDAGPGDPRTTKNNYLALWQNDVYPSPIPFNDAPIGLYSKVSLAIDGQLVNNSVEIDGMVQYSGNNHPFTIRDRNILPIALDTDKMLAPGATIKIGLHIDFRPALGGIDWSQAHNNNGTLELDSVQPSTLLQLAMFEGALLGSFSLQDQSSHATTEN